jgi:hypothetical protein
MTLIPRIIPVAAQTKRELPGIIERAVRHANPPPGYEGKTANAYDAFVTGFARDMASASVLPVTEVRMEEMEYQHSIMDASVPEFPNGYPVIGVYLNGLLAGITGVTFEGTRCTFKQAETKTAMFILNRGGKGGS